MSHDNRQHITIEIFEGLNYNAMFYKTFVCFYVSEAKPLGFSLCSQMFDDVEYATFKMIVTQMCNYLFVISFQLMFYKTLCNRLARALRIFNFSFNWYSEIQWH